MSLTEILGVDDGLSTLYNVDLDAAPNHVQHTGTTVRSAIKFETGSAGIGQKIQSVWVRGQKYGTNPTGDITVNIRKISDDSAVLIGTFDIRHFGTGEQSFAVRNRQNNYEMLAGDFVSVEYPAGASGFEISTNSVASDPSGYTSRSFTTVWSSALSDPLAVTIKGI